MYNVNFRENPNQLFGVFTTPENILRVKEWMKESGFNPEQVYTFESFLEVVKVKSQEIDSSLKNSIRYEVNLPQDFPHTPTVELRRDSEQIEPGNN